jgi:uncharacterized membrane protein YkoI
MNNKRKWIAGTAIAVVLAGGASGAAVANSGGGADDRGEHSHAIKGRAYDRAKAAALKETGGGTVTETEAGDEESYYQVEVRNADGSNTDVNLDRHFEVVKTKTENESHATDAND